MLDVGCGSGSKSKYLAKHGLKVMGIDFSEKLIEIARRESPEIRFEVMRMQDVSRLQQTFDGVFAQASLLHIPRNEIKAVLSDLASSVNKGGYLYVAVKGPKEGLPLEETKTESDYGYEYERFFSYHSLDELRGYLKELGLEIAYENTNRVGRTDWIQVIGRKYVLLDNASYSR